MSQFTYSMLEQRLLSLGFTFQGIREQNKLFLHKETGAVIAYPDFPKDQAVLPRHLLMASSILRGFGIDEATDLSLLLVKAS
jgi:hypothetical protein